MNQRQRRPIRSREERATSAEGVSGGDAGTGDRGAGEGLEALRSRAQAMGSNLSKGGGSRRFRPEADAKGKIRTTCWLSPEVRKAMEYARLELNLSYSAIADLGIVMFLEAQGLRVEGFGQGQDGR